MSNVTTEQELGSRPLPADEYDTYLLYIISRLEANCGLDEIYSYLCIAENDYMMLSYPSGNKNEFISSIEQYISYS